MKTFEENLAEHKALIDAQTEKARLKGELKIRRANMREAEHKARTVNNLHNQLVRAKLDGADVETILDLEARLEELVCK